jgi:diguanylate cyclase (GGDEF)-like protein
LGRISANRILAAWLALSACVQGQQYVFRAYGQAEGLKNLAVNALTQDSSGTLWLATENGVYRFLGSSFERLGPEHGIAETNVRDIVADANGAVWVSTGENLYRWGGKGFLPAGPKPVHLQRQWRMAVENKRSLLVVDNGRLYRLEHDAQGRMLSYLPVIPDILMASVPDLGRVFSVSVLRKAFHGHRIWVGCGKRIYSLPSGRIGNRLGTGEGEVEEWGVDQGLAADDFQKVFLDRAGTLWAAGLKHVMVLPVGATRFIDRSIPGSDPENRYGHAPMVEDPEGRILVPTEEGVARWDKTGWRLLGRENGLHHTSHISGIAFDTGGDLWLSSRGGGIYQWVGYQNWEAWTDTQGLPSALIWTIRSTGDGRAMIGTERGPAWIDPQSGSVGLLSSTRPWPYGQVTTTGVDRNGSIWAGTFSGITLRIDAKTGRTVETARLPAAILSATEDEAGRLFLATDRGIYIRDAVAPNAAPHGIRAVDALLGNSTRVDASCQAPGGALWFLSANRLLRLEAGQWTAPPIDGLPHRLQGSFLALSCAQDGSIWVAGEQSGVWKLTLGSGRIQAGRLELPPGWNFQSIVAMLVDRRGWVWLGTDAGVFAWNGTAWRHLTQESGLIWNDVDLGAISESADGSVWIGTSGGVSHLLHPERAFDPTPMDVQISEISRAGELYTGAQSIVLPWTGKPLHFQVSSHATRNRSELVFKLWMVGLYSDWIDTKTGTATFPNLPPGTYTFKAMASNPGLDAYSSIVKVQVRVLPPWWRTLWFYALCGLAFLCLAIAGDRVRARHLRQTRKRLERLVIERTRELEASREQLRIQATHDGLTGMLNRVGILRALAVEMDRSRREARPLVIALVDLDDFKTVNDLHGHMGGDEALRWFAAAVGAAIRAYDHAGRYGGEEFLLVLAEIPQAAVEQRLASLHASISNLLVHTREADFTLNCSLGATVFDPLAGPSSSESLLAIADEALYAAKAAGRNRFVFSSAADSPLDIDTQPRKPYVAL